MILFKNPLLPLPVNLNASNYNPAVIQLQINRLKILINKPDIINPVNVNNSILFFMNHINIKDALAVKDKSIVKIAQTLYNIILNLRVKMNPQLRNMRTFPYRVLYIVLSQLSYKIFHTMLNIYLKLRLCFFYFLLFTFSVFTYCFLCVRRGECFKCT